MGSFCTYFFRMAILLDWSRPTTTIDNSYYFCLLSLIKSCRCSFSSSEVSSAKISFNSFLNTPLSKSSCVAYHLMTSLVVDYRKFAETNFFRFATACPLFSSYSYSESSVSSAISRLSSNSGVSTSSSYVVVCSRITSLIDSSNPVLMIVDLSYYCNP